MNAFILILVVLGVLGWWFTRKRRRFGRIGGTNRRQGGSARTIPPRLMRELDRLTRDRRVSERLIERISFDNPGRSGAWCVEKAIYDIQRDRRS